MTTSSRVGIVGLGLSSPLGADLDGAWARLMAGESAIGLMSFEGLPDIAAARVQEDVAAVLPKLQQVGTERVSQMALAAARRSIDDAGCGPWADAERVGLYLGTGMGGASTIDSAYAALYAGRRVPPLTVPTSMVNAAAAQLALQCQIRGPVLTYAVACASSAAALAEAAHALRRGEVDVAIAGGVEAVLTKGTVAAWQALRTLAPPHEADPARSCRPFSPDRAGLVLGEGAAFFVLQREDDALREGRRIRAWLAGSAISCDAAHLTNPDQRGQMAALRRALAAAGLQPADVGYCNAHGTATVAGDPVECAALRELWAEAAPALRVSSTKAAHGHMLGAAGAVEALWTVLALERGEIPPTAGTQALDPACTGLGHVLGQGERAAGLRHALSNSFAFGGTNVSLVFSKAE
ncbi:beta-ketoacyl synthase [Pelomonas sp. KK5]|uniref:beta-ketoacyl-[acyl-carrier-protein] synthase family protein n=1 Tax=Pelomonas sp. KK5 TaxID=1855730 RepID=UPI00097BBF91|nr:beta-ketoacyl-[acyl-carrier-protein] synthase family protein [Pelomonas sp. KK5]